jgi:hypothetical protein
MMRRSLCLMAALATVAVTVQVTAQDFNDPRIQRELDALEKEPTIQEAQAAALKFFNIDADTVSSMRTRASVKALVPSVGARVRGNQSTINLDRIDLLVNQNDPTVLDDGQGTVLEFEVSAAWDFSKLVFNSEVLDVSSLVVLQEAILKEITRIYYTRRRLQVDLILTPPADPATKLSKELRIQELTATLDAMTGNLFSNASARPVK